MSPSARGPQGSLSIVYSSAALVTANGALKVSSAPVTRPWTTSSVAWGTRLKLPGGVTCRSGGYGFGAGHGWATCERPPGFRVGAVFADVTVVVVGDLHERSDRSRAFSGCVGSGCRAVAFRLGPGAVREHDQERPAALGDVHGVQRASRAVGDAHRVRAEDPVHQPPPVGGGLLARLGGRRRPARVGDFGEGGVLVRPRHFGRDGASPRLPAGDHVAVGDHAAASFAERAAVGGTAGVGGQDTGADRVEAEVVVEGAVDPELAEDAFLDAPQLHAHEPAGGLHEAHPPRGTPAGSGTRSDSSFHLPGCGSPAPAEGLARREAGTAAPVRITPEAASATAAVPSSSSTAAVTSSSRLPRLLVRRAWDRGCSTARRSSSSRSSRTRNLWLIRRSTLRPRLPPAPPGALAALSTRVPGRSARRPRAGGPPRRRGGPRPPSS